MLCSSSEKLTVCFTMTSNLAVTTWVSINNVRWDLFLKGIFIMDQRTQFTRWLENKKIKKNWSSAANMKESLVVYSLVVRGSSIGTKNFASLYVGVAMEDKIGLTDGRASVTILWTSAEPYIILFHLLVKIFSIPDDGLLLRVKRQNFKKKHGLIDWICIYLLLIRMIYNIQIYDWNCIVLSGPIYVHRNQG